MRILKCLFLLAILVQALHAEDGDLKSIKQITCANDKVEIFRIEYISGSDKLRIKGYLVLPKMIADAPCVIYNRGGNNLDDYNSNGDDDFGKITDQFACNVLANLALRNGEETHGGTVVIASQYRGLGPDRGQGPLDMDEFGGRDVEDVLNLIPLLDNFESGNYLTTLDPDQDPPRTLSGRLDPARIAMFGWSRGGMMTYLALRRLRERGECARVKTAIVGAGVADLFDSEIRRPGLARGVHAKLIPEYDNRRFDQLRERSAVFWVDELPAETPILLLHGTADSDVDISQARRMHVLLHRRNRANTSFFVEGVDHGFGGHPMYRSLRETTRTKWFQLHL